MTKINYYPPMVDILEVETEQGIAISNEGFQRAAKFDLYLDDENE